MTEFGKLVRNNIPDIIRANGEEPVTRQLDPTVEYIEALGDKLVEEATEAQETPCLEELADTLEVVYALGKALGYTPAQIEEARAQKAAVRGGFEKRIFLVRNE